MDGFDLGEELDEEREDQAFPHLRLERAFVALIAQADYEEALELLQGADGHQAVSINCVDAVGVTALHKAALNGDIEGIQFLLA